MSTGPDYTLAPAVPVAATTVEPHRRATDRVAQTAPPPAFGARLADAIAAFGGSWRFIGLSIALLLAWTLLNAFVLAPRHRAFDPYPFVFLNLLLSMVAALQAPVIMMSQNRQADHDRLAAARDFEVNTRAELEVDGLHRKLDALRQDQWMDLIQRRSGRATPKR